MSEISKFAFHLFLLTLIACGGGGDATNAPSTPLEKGSFVLTSSVAEVQFDYDELIYLTAEIHGIQGRFILDSGADVFVITPELANRAGLEVVGSTAIHTIAGVSRVPVRRISNFSFSNVVGVDIDAAEVSLNGIDGIIGLPFFEAVVLETDLLGERLRIHDPATTSLESLQSVLGGAILPAPGFVVDMVKVDGVDVGRMRIDTGTGGGIRLSTAQKSELIDGQTETAPVVSAAANGQVGGTALIAPRVEVFDLAFHDQFVVLQDRPLDVGLIGTQILEQLYFVSDMATGRILVRRDRDRRYALE